MLQSSKGGQLLSRESFKLQHQFNKWIIEKVENWGSWNIQIQNKMSPIRWKVEAYKEIVPTPIIRYSTAEGSIWWCMHMQAIHLHAQLLQQYSWVCKECSSIWKHNLQSVKSGPLHWQGTTTQQSQLSLQIIWVHECWKGGQGKLM